MDTMNKFYDLLCVKLYYFLFMIHSTKFEIMVPFTSAVKRQWQRGFFE